jgi:hypothetical protein
VSPTRKAVAKSPAKASAKSPAKAPGAKKATVTSALPQAKVTIVNASTVCTDAEIQSYIAPLQVQVSQHFAPAWGHDAVLSFTPKGSKPDPSAWWLAILDTSDQAGALGYHDLTNTGQPLGKVFAASDKQYKMSVSVTISHELLEMLGDPGINMVASGEDKQGNPAFYAFEACDACEDDSYGYAINGVTVSDFVYPSWFGGVAGGPYDYKGHISKPFTILSGGYIGMWTPSTGWTQITGDNAHGAAHRSRPNVGSRRERRRVGQARWSNSDV